MTRVMIDPGHGGKDPGALGRDPVKIREAEVVWSVATLTRAALERNGLTVATSRRQAEYLPPIERARAANTLGVVAFVSIHCNSHETSRARGIEVLHYGSAEGKRLAASILRLLKSSPPIGPTPRNRGLVERPRLTVLKRTRMPACLVELPFVSNPDDLAALIEPANQIFWAQAVADGVVDWLV